jgi:hypothetical protein
VVFFLDFIPKKIDIKKIFAENCVRFSSFIYGDIPEQIIEKKYLEK